MMTVRDVLNRGVNLLAVSIVAISGFAFAPEMLAEDDMPDKLDDALLFVLALAGMWWYSRGGNKTARSIAPVVLSALAFVIKLGAVIIESGDADALGDDMGGLILFALALGLVIYQYKKVGKLLALQS